MRIIRCAQGSAEWFQARIGVATASEIDALVSPTWKVRTGDGVDSYVARKLAEKWRGEPLPTFGGGAMEQGSIKEGEAIPWLEFEQNLTVERVGFVLSDDGRMGCSPDGLIGHVGLEVKCPMPHTQVSYLLDGILPKEYAAQVQYSMAVTGFKQWRFLSYARGIPSLLLTIERDEEAQKSIAIAVSAFNATMDYGYARLVELNGGPPAPRAELRIADVNEPTMDFNLGEIL